jgi:hypothetical protein
MSDDIKQQKETLLRQLLKDKPDIGMKEANAVIRDQFDTGVSPPVFSKVRRAMLEESTQTLKATAQPEEESNQSTKKSPTKSKKEKPTKKTNKVEASEQNDTVVGRDDESKGPEAKPKEPSKSKAKANKPKSKQEEEQPADDTRGEKDKRQKQAENKQAEPEPKEPEPEIDPNLPRFPVKIEVDIDLSQSFSEVHLCGGFNLWKTDELAMVKNEHKNWVFEGELPQGEYTYKFVIDRKLWYLDFSRRRVTDKTGVSHPITIGEESANGT